MASHGVAQALLWVIASWGSFCHCGEPMALGEQFHSPKSGLEQRGVPGNFLAEV